MTVVAGFDPTEIRLSDNAVSKLQHLIEDEANPSLRFRVYITGGGCSGFQYVFSIVDQVNKDDHVFERNNCRVIIDKTSLQFLEGAKIDYSEELIGSSFKINNPNATSSCGCGTSFSFSPSFE